jgi:hypothetical protein
MTTVDLDFDNISMISEDKWNILHSWAQEPTTIICPQTKMVTISFTIIASDKKLNPKLAQSATIGDVAFSYKSLLFDYYSLFIDLTAQRLPGQFGPGITYKNPRPMTGFRQMIKHQIYSSMYYLIY